MMGCPKTIERHHTVTDYDALGDDFFSNLCLTLEETNNKDWGYGQVTVTNVGGHCVNKKFDDADEDSTKMGELSGYTFWTVDNVRVKTIDDVKAQFEARSGSQISVVMHKLGEPHAGGCAGLYASGKVDNQSWAKPYAMAVVEMWSQCKTERDNVWQGLKNDGTVDQIYDTGPRYDVYGLEGMFGTPAMEEEAYLLNQVFLQWYQTYNSATTEGAVAIQQIPERSSIGNMLKDDWRILVDPLVVTKESNAKLHTWIDNWTYDVDYLSEQAFSKFARPPPAGQSNHQYVRLCEAKDSSAEVKEPKCTDAGLTKDKRIWALASVSGTFLTSDHAICMDAAFPCVTVDGKVVLEFTNKADLKTAIDLVSPKPNKIGFHTSMFLDKCTGMTNLKDGLTALAGAPDVFGNLQVPTTVHMIEVSEMSFTVVDNKAVLALNKCVDASDVVVDSTAPGANCAFDPYFEYTRKGGAKFQIDSARQLKNIRFADAADDTTTTIEFATDSITGQTTSIKRTILTSVTSTADTIAVSDVAFGAVITAMKLKSGKVRVEFEVDKFETFTMQYDNDGEPVEDVSATPICDQGGTIWLSPSARRMKHEYENEQHIRAASGIHDWDAHPTGPHADDTARLVKQVKVTETVVAFAGITIVAAHRRAVAEAISSHTGRTISSPAAGPTEGDTDTAFAAATEFSMVADISFTEVTQHADVTSRCGRQEFEGLSVTVSVTSAQTTWVGLVAHIQTEFTGATITKVVDSLAAEIDVADATGSANQVDANVVTAVQVVITLATVTVDVACDIVVQNDPHLANYCFPFFSAGSWLLQISSQLGHFWNLPLCAGSTDWGAWEHVMNAFEGLVYDWYPNTVANSALKWISSPPGNSDRIALGIYEQQKAEEPLFVYYSPAANKQYLPKYETIEKFTHGFKIDKSQMDFLIDITKVYGAPVQILSVVNDDVNLWDKISIDHNRRVLFCQAENDCRFVEKILGKTTNIWANSGQQVVPVGGSFVNINDVNNALELCASESVEVTTETFAPDNLEVTTSTATSTVQTTECIKLLSSAACALSSEDVPNSKTSDDGTVVTVVTTPTPQVDCKSPYEFPRTDDYEASIKQVFQDLFTGDAHVQIDLEAEDYDDVACRWLKDPSNQRIHNLVPAICQPGWGTSGFGSCAICNPGEHGVGGASKCVFAPPGTITSGAGQVEPETCSPGTVPNELRTKCVPCDKGSIASAPGVATCLPVPLGHYSNDARTRAMLCPKHHYNDVVGGECQSCPSDKQVTFGEGATSVDDCVCMAGYYAERNMLPDENTHETAADLVNILTQNFHGQVTIGSNILGENGRLVFAVQTKSADGEITSVASMTDLNSYFNKYAVEDETFKSQSDLTAILDEIPADVTVIAIIEPDYEFELCLPCFDMQTDTLATKHPDALYGFQCPAGSDWAKYALSAGTTAPAAADGRRLADDGDASGGIDENEFGIMEGYWAAQAEPKGVYTCATKNRCPGGLPESCPPNFDSSIQACAKCDDNHWDDNGVCTECDGGNTALPAILILVGILFLGAAYVLCNNPHRPQTSPLLFTCIALGMVIIATQSLAVMNEVFTFDKEPLASMMQVTTFVRFNKDLWRVDCVVDTTTMGLFVGKNMMPNFVALVYIGGFVVAYTYATVTNQVQSLIVQREKTIWATFHPTRFINAFCLIIQTLFVVVTLNCLEPFTCVPNPNGTKSMALFRDTTCTFEGDHATMVVLSVVFMAIYSIG